MLRLSIAACGEDAQINMLIDCSGRINGSARYSQRGLRIKEPGTGTHTLSAISLNEPTVPPLESPCWNYLYAIRQRHRRCRRTHNRPVPKRKTQSLYFRERLYV